MPHAPDAGHDSAVAAPVALKPVTYSCLICGLALALLVGDQHQPHVHNEQPAIPVFAQVYVVNVSTSGSFQSASVLPNSTSSFYTV